MQICKILINWNNSVIAAAGCYKYRWYEATPTQYFISEYVCPFEAIFQSVPTYHALTSIME